MILPDVNVLIYAFRSDSAAHVPVKAWLEEVGGG
jgi:predicted nucleic acid-binding protein